MKKRFFAMVLALLLTLSAGAAYADIQRVYDNASLFSEEQAAILEEAASAMSEAHGVDFIILTEDSGVGDTAEYAMDFVESLGLGQEGKGSALFFLDMENRTTYIDTTRSMIEIIDDAREEEIFDAQMDYLAEGDYASAMGIALTMAEEYVIEGAKEDVYVYDEDTGEVLDPEEYGGESADLGFFGVVLGLVFGAIAGLIIGLITRAVIRSSYAKKYKPAKYDMDSNTTLKLNVNNTRQTNKFVTTRRIPRNDSSSGGRSGGSGSGTRVSSGGMRHGGGGRRF